jgi:Kyanoviridae head maturation protease
MTSLITESLTFDQAGMIVEAEDDPTKEGSKKSLYLKGIFIQGGVRNFNERVYPVREINKAVIRLNEVMQKGESVLGECDHPEELTINLDRVSHVITQMWMDGTNGMGKLKIVPTPMGQLIRTLIESDVKLGVSSRGVGNVDDRGEVSGFEIITVDIVARPSAPDAFPKPVYESLNTKRGRIIDDLAVAAVHDPMAMRFLKEEMLKAITELKWKI